MVTVTTARPSLVLGIDGDATKANWVACEHEGHGIAVIAGTDSAVTGWKSGR